jgi:hypothetical protein
MNQLINQFAQDSRKFMPDSVKRQQLLPIVIGFAVAAFFPVAESKEFSPELHFNQHIRPSLMTRLSRLNEDMVFDITRAKDAAKACHTMRHRIFNQVPVAYTGGVENTIFGLAFGLSNLIVPADFECLAQHNVEVSEMYCRAITMIRNLTETGVL